MSTSTSAKRSEPNRPLTLTLAEHLHRLRQQFPAIRPFEEEDDVEWWNDGLDALDANRLDLAERIFKKLVLAQPNHFDGYFGLAQVYHRQRSVQPAILFADEALRLAQASLDDGSLDPSTLDELREFRRQLDPASAGSTPEPANPDASQQKSRPV